MMPDMLTYAACVSFVNIKNSIRYSPEGEGERGDDVCTSLYYTYVRYHT